MVHAALARLGRAATVEEVFLEVCNRRNPIAFTTTYRALCELVRRALSCSTLCREVVGFSTRWHLHDPRLLSETAVFYANANRSHLD